MKAGGEAEQDARGRVAVSLGLLTQVEAFAPNKAPHTGRSAPARRVVGDHERESRTRVNTALLAAVKRHLPKAVMESLAQAVRSKPGNYPDKIAVGRAKRVQQCSVAEYKEWAKQALDPFDVGGSADADDDSQLGSVMGDGHVPQAPVPGHPATTSKRKELGELSTWTQCSALCVLLFSWHC